MTTVHRYNEKFLVISKGAVESVEASLSDDNPRKEILQKGIDMASNGIRVIAYAYNILANSLNHLFMKWWRRICFMPAWQA